MDESSVPPVENPAPQLVPSQGMGKNKKLFLIIGLAIFLILSGSGVFAYYRYVNDPANVVKKALRQLVDVKSFELSNVATNRYSTKSDEGSTVTRTNGHADIADDQNLKMEFTSVSTYVRKDSLTSSSIFPTLSTSSLSDSFTSEVRLIGNDFYAKIEDPFSKYLFSSVSSTNPWLKFDKKFNELIIPSLVGVSTLSKYYNEQNGWPFSLMEMGSRALLEIRQALRLGTVVLEPQLIQEGSTGNATDRHYQFLLDKTEVKTRLVSLAQALFPQIKDVDIASIEKDVNNIQELKGEVWISKDNSLSRVSLMFVAPQPAYLTADGTGSVTHVLTLSRLNEPVIIEKPASATDFNDYLLERTALPNLFGNESGSLIFGNMFSTSSDYLTTSASKNNIKRTSDVRLILDAVGMRLNDGNGVWQQAGVCKVALPQTLTMIGKGPDEIDLEPCLTPKYITAMPHDPLFFDSLTKSTGYSIFQNHTTKRVTIGAPLAESEVSGKSAPTISITR